MTPTPIVETIEAIRRHVSRPHAAAKIVGFVPTMGALHGGHGRLIEHARRDCDLVVTSIFVNPLQFDRSDDLERYPRTLDADAALCTALGVDVIFAPRASEMYPTRQVCVVDVGHLANHLCGKFRPGHFAGVATVVMKLLQIVQPHRAYFGEKDAQQLAIIRRMVRDLNVPVEIVGVTTAREPDGLALSSRNRLLTASERAQAPLLFKALQRVTRLIADGHRDTADIIRTAAEAVPQAAEIRLEYLEIVDPEELQPVTTIDGPVLIAGAMWVGATRLIDNIGWAPAGSTRSAGATTPERN
jgi:pantoate--beta-alanine ligase